MKILFFRHGESTDDLDNQYGGWADFDLTEKGRQQALDRVTNIKNFEISFDAILVSPLKRAFQVGEIFAKELDLPLNTLEYVKEMNGYGVLSGMNKLVAAEKYPDQVEALKNGEWVYGSETKEQRNARVIKSLNVIRTLPYENIIIVTHGGYSGRFFDNFLHKKLTNIGDLAYYLVEISDDEVKLIESDGVEFE